MSDTRPVDMAAIRARFAALARPDATVQRDAGAMADEIERLREGIRKIADHVEAGEIEYGDMLHDVADLRALLPPS
jgi:hypothetical protein